MKSGDTAAFWDWIRYVAPPVLVAATLYYLSSRPLPSDLPMVPGLDKVYHAIAYAILGFFAARAVAFGRPAAWRWSILGALIAIAYGALDEWHQSFVPQREADLLDLAADAGGGLVGATVWQAAELMRGRG